MLRVTVKDRQGRVKPVITKVTRRNRVQGWINDCRYCISYFKGENPNPRWNHDRWAHFAGIPWEDIEYEVSDILEVGQIFTNN